MHTFFAWPETGRVACPSSPRRERSEELIDRVRQIEHAKPERHRDQKGIDLARGPVDSPQRKARMKSGAENQPPHRDHLLGSDRQIRCKDRASARSAVLAG